MTPVQIQQALIQASPEYADLVTVLQTKVNTLPPSSAMAGIYTAVDQSHGVWTAPANVSVTATTNTTLYISDASQAYLNVDPVTGKSIDAIRTFTGRGVVVWGVRTLDGNSLDWRYVHVRRTMIMIEQSLKLASNAFVFDPNDCCHLDRDDKHV